MDFWIGIRKPGQICGENVIPFFNGNMVGEYSHCFGKEPAHAMQKPIDLGVRKKENTPENEPYTTRGVGLPVGEGQS